MRKNASRHRKALRYYSCGSSILHRGAQPLRQARRQMRSVEKSSIMYRQCVVGGPGASAPRVLFGISSRSARQLPGVVRAAHRRSPGEGPGRECQSIPGGIAREAAAPRDEPERARAFSPPQPRASFGSVLFPPAHAPCNRLIEQPRLIDAGDFARLFG